MDYFANWNLYEFYKVFNPVHLQNLVQVNDLCTSKSETNQYLLEIFTHFEQTPHAISTSPITRKWIVFLAKRLETCARKPKVPVLVRLLATCRGELSVVTSRLMSGCLRSAWKWWKATAEIVFPVPCCPVNCECSWKKTLIEKKLK